MQKNKEELSKLQKRLAELQAIVIKKQFALALLHKRHADYQQQWSEAKDLASQTLISAYHLSYISEAAVWLIYYQYLNQACVDTIDNKSIILKQVEEKQQHTKKEKAILEKTVTQQQKTQQQLTSTQKDRQHHLEKL